jgi:uncharacterized delta-60 repeat protein
MKQLHIILSIAVLLFSAGNTFSVPPVEEWVQRYNGPANEYDYAYSIAVDSSGNVYVTGCSYSNMTDNDYVTIKYDTYGTEQWVTRYDGPGSGADEAYSIALDDAGNAYVTGYSIGLTSSDYATIKYDGSGIQQWVARYDGPAEDLDAGIALAVNQEGVVFVTGFSQGIGSGYDYATIRYSSEGAEQWVSRYSGEANGGDEPFDIAVDESGNTYVTGYSYNGSTSFDYITIKYDSDGTEQWVEKYDGPANGGDLAYAIAVDDLENVYVTGYSYGDSTYSDYLTIKYNSNGAEQWIVRYSGPGNSTDIAEAIALDQAGNVYVTGHSTGIDTDDDYATIKYDSNGIEQWVARYDGPLSEDDYAYDIALDDAGNVYVTGYTTATNTYSDCTTIKYDNNGAEQWAVTYDGPESDDDEGYELALDSAGNIYVTGYSTGTGTEYDYTTIKYSQETGIGPSEESEGFQLFRVFPNPSSDFLTIAYYIPEATDASIGIYNILGRLVSQAASGEHCSGFHQVQMEGMSSGLYFCRLETDEASLTESFVIIR